jgi:hypothetical protein
MQSGGTTRCSVLFCFCFSGQLLRADEQTAFKRAVSALCFLPFVIPSRLLFVS